MIALLLASGCFLLTAGPREALQQAAVAFEAGDLVAFEQVVDVDAVAPDVISACQDLGGRLVELDAQQFQRPSLAADVGEALADAVRRSPEVYAEIVAKLRADFTSLGDDASPITALCDPLRVAGEVRFELPDGDRAEALLPVSIDTVQADARLRFERRAGDWMLVGVDLSDALHGYERHQLDAAHRRAAELLAALPASREADHWAALRAYLHNRPEDTEIAAAYHEMLEPLVSAATPLEVTRTWMEPAGFLGMWRNARVSVRSPDRDAQGFVVQFWFADGMGEELTLTRTALTRRDVTGGETVDSAGVRVGMARAVSARGVVTRVTWADGEEWVHPAVLAGAW